MDTPTLNDLFPAGSRLLLTGGGKEFVERIGVEATRRAVLAVLLGENIRSQTEPLTRRRIAQISGAILALFANGYATVDGFAAKLSDMATTQIASSRKNDKGSIWPAQWLIGGDKHRSRASAAGSPAAQSGIIAPHTYSPARRVCAPCLIPL